MARPYSIDLRERVVQAVERDGLSRRQAADRFGVGIKTAIDWVRRFRETGSMAARPMGGCRPKKIVGQHRDWLLERCRDQAFHPARSGRRAGRAWLAGRLPDGLGLRSPREADVQKKRRWLPASATGRM